MGWRPADVRACSLPDFQRAVEAWNAMQDEATGKQTMSADEARAMRQELGWNG